MKEKNIFIFNRAVKTVFLLTVFVLGIIRFDTLVHATSKMNEFDAYEKFLKQSQTLNCQGNMTRMKIGAFNVVDIDNDNIYELLIADKNKCSNSYRLGHTHVVLYKYVNKQVSFVQGILTLKGKEGTVYVSQSRGQVAIRSFTGEWLSMDKYGNYSNLGKKPSFARYKKYKLYQNTASNRKKYLSKARKSSEIVTKYRKKISDIEIKFEKLEKSMSKTGNKVVDRVDDAYDSLKKDSLKTLSKKIETILASNLPESAEKAFVKVFTDTIQEKLIQKSTTYNNCKTAPQLVNKVAGQIMKEKGRFSFVDKKMTYTATFQSLGVPGATYVSGTVISNAGKSYVFGGTITSKSTIKEELDNLKKYSDKKIEEAKKAVLTDSADLLVPSTLRTYLKTTSKSKLYKVIKRKSPSIAKIVKNGIGMVDKFMEVKKAYTGLKSIDLKNTSEGKIIKTIANYDKKVKAFEKAVDSVF